MPGGNEPNLQLAESTSNESILDGKIMSDLRVINVLNIQLYKTKKSFNLVVF